MKKSEIIERINGINAEKLNAAAHAIISSNPVNAITTNRAGYISNGGTKSTTRTPDAHTSGRTAPAFISIKS